MKSNGTPSSILYHSPTSSLALIDIPRSLELAQSLSFPSRPITAHSNSHFNSRIISCPALENPFPSTEAKTRKAKRNVEEVGLEELVLRKWLRLCLDEVGEVLGQRDEEEEEGGKWCWDRVVRDENMNRDGDGDEDEDENLEMGKEKRKRGCDEMKTQQLLEASSLSTRLGSRSDDNPSFFRPNKNDPILFHNDKSASISLTVTLPLSSSSTSSQPPPDPTSKHHIPPKSTFISGPIEPTLEIFTSSSPLFNLIILDPPWPNRSARRKKDYALSYDTHSIKTLLNSLPLEERLEDKGYIAVWVTHKSVFREMVVGKEGLFEKWGVQWVEEWVWLKVTGEGKPVFDLDEGGGQWRKPWECLLVGRRVGDGDREVGEKGVERRVMIAVPDLHSRKPNLKELGERWLGLGGGIGGNGERGSYQALEVFARNLTAGWWAWGDEVLKFQNEECWVDG